MELETAKRPINWIGSGLLAKTSLKLLTALIATRAAFFRTQVRLQIFFKCPPGSIMIVRRLAYFLPVEAPPAVQRRRSPLCLISPR